MVEVEKKDSNTRTLVTVSRDRILKEWNINTYECLSTFSVSSIPYSQMKPMRDGRKTTLIWGTDDGELEIRRLSDFSVITSLPSPDKPKNYNILCICELEDGSFVSGAYGRLWRCKVEAESESIQVIQDFRGHSDWIIQVIELKRDVIVSASFDRTLRIWKVSTGECLHRLTLHTKGIYGLVKLSEDKFVSVSADSTMRVWDDSGRCIETITTEHCILRMTRVNDLLITLDSTNSFQVWRLK